MTILAIPVSINVSGSSRLVIASDGYLEQYNSGTRVYRIPLDSISVLTVSGSENADTLELDVSGGIPVPAGGMTFSGGNGSDTVRVTGTLPQGALAVQQGYNATVGTSGTLSLNGLSVGYTSVELESILAGTSSITAVLPGGSRSIALQDGISVGTGVTGGRLASSGLTQMDFVMPQSLAVRGDASGSRVTLLGTDSEFTVPGKLEVVNMASITLQQSLKSTGSGSAISLGATGSISIGSKSLDSSGKLSVVGGSVLSLNQVHAGESFAIQATGGSVTMASTARLVADTGTGLLSASGTVQLAGTLVGAAAGLTIQSGSTSTTAISVTGTPKLSVTAGDLSVASEGGIRFAATTIETSGITRLTAKGQVDLGQVTADKLFTSGTSLLATGNVKAREVGLSHSAAMTFQKDLETGLLDVESKTSAADLIFSGTSRLILNLDVSNPPMRSLVQVTGAGGDVIFQTGSQLIVNALLPTGASAQAGQSVDLVKVNGGKIYNSGTVTKRKQGAQEKLGNFGSTDDRIFIEIANG